MVCGWCGEEQVEDQPSWLWCFQATQIRAVWSEVASWCKSPMVVVCHPLRDGDDAAGGLCWAASIRDHSWPLFRRPKLLWDSLISVFITYLAVFRCNFRIRLHNECMGSSVLRENEDAISICYPWTDLSEKWVFGGTSIVRLSWNLPLIQWCGSVRTFQWYGCLSFLSLIRTFLSFLYRCGCSGIAPKGTTVFLIFIFNKVGMYSSSPSRGE